MGGQSRFARSMLFSKRVGFRPSVDIQRNLSRCSSLSHVCSSSYSVDYAAFEPRGFSVPCSCQSGGGSEGFWSEDRCTAESPHVSLAKTPQARAWLIIR